MSRKLLVAGGALTLVLCSTSAAVAAPLARSADPQAHATRIGPAPLSQRLQLVFPLRSDLTGLAQLALSVSTPGSPDYGAYERFGRLAHRFGASATTRRRVVAFLRGAGARNVTVDPTGLFADATVGAGLAARLFSTPLAEFRGDQGTHFIAPARAGAAAGAVILPAGLRGLVRGVVGLDTRPLRPAPPTLPRATGHLRPAPPTLPPATGHLRAVHAASQAPSMRPRTGRPTGCPAGVGSGGFTPNQYLTAYGYDVLHAEGISGQGERVALIEIDGFKYSDIRTFAQCFGLRIPAVNAIGVGVPKRLPPGGESTLDLEVLDAAAPGLKSIDVYEARPDASATLQALTAPLRNQQKPQVVSVSLGLCEDSLTRSVGGPGIDAAEAALQMAAASGITYLAASGDQGSADCTGPGGSVLDRLAVNYPASSWWVTGVGGTNLVLDAANQIVSQVVWNDGTVQPGSAAGGGSSTIFRRPNYQASVAGPAHRAVPDVSMLADLIPGDAIYCSARGDCLNSGNSDPWQTVGGTSAATPLLAAGFALVDQDLRLHGRQDLGLANPLLYALARTSAAASVFYDVMAIGNDVGPDISANGLPLGCCSAGLGYDRASGLGSVKLAGFAALAIVAQLPVTRVGLSLPAHQRPVAAHEIRATLYCSGPCLMGAFAEVAVGHSRPFEVDSSVTRLRSSGRATIALRFSAKQLRRLRSALAAGTPVHAAVRGVLFDRTVYNVLPAPSDSIQQRTRLESLTLAG